MRRGRQHEWPESMRLKRLTADGRENNTELANALGQGAVECGAESCLSEL